MAHDDQFGHFRWLLGPWSAKRVLDGAPVASVKVLRSSLVLAAPQQAPCRLYGSGRPAVLHLSDGIGQPDRSTAAGAIQGLLDLMQPGGQMRWVSVDGHWGVSMVEVDPAANRDDPVSEILPSSYRCRPTGNRSRGLRVERLVPEESRKIRNGFECCHLA
jgi:hypothetical protein